MNGRYKTKLKFALVINLVIVLLEIVGLILSVQRHGVGVFMFYTENSNYFALIVSIIFSVFAFVELKERKTIPKWVKVLRHTTTVCLSITFLVVLFVLIPMMPSMTSYLLVEGSSSFQHVLCPILSVVSFIFFENDKLLEKRDIFLAIIPTITYGTIILFLNFIKVVTGPYPFFYVYVVPWYFSSSLCVGIFLFSIAISYVIYFLHNRKLKRQLKEDNLVKESV